MKQFSTGLKRFGQSVADYIRETDKLLLILCALASCYGCALVLSATNYTGSHRQFFVQVSATLLGICAAIFISLFDYKNICRFWPVFAGLSVALLAFTYIWGYTPEGTDNKAWIELPFGMSIQVSELIKVFFIITFSAHVNSIGRDEINRPINVLLLCLHGVAPAALVMVLQRDLGNVIVLLIIFAAMLFSAGVKLRYFAVGGALVALASPIIWFYGLSEYQRQRFAIIMDLESDAKGMGYQQLQSIRAIGSGGLTGYGFMNGPKTQSAGVPKAYNDFIFSVAGEELGLIGALLLVGILVAIMVRVIRISTLSRDAEGSTICAGVFGLFAAQTLINIGMCLAVLPVIGVTLPFFSAGGSSMVCLYLSVGLALSVYKSRNSRQITLKEE